MITILQHGEHEGPGSLSGYLRERQLPHEILRLYEDDEIPGDLPEKLVILGGQMSVNDTREYPVFTREKNFAKEMIRKNRPVLGICLGAQMIASAFGEVVRKGNREIGWCPVKVCSPEWHPLFPETFPVFHWHEETFNLPPGATLLATGDAVKNQAFRLGSAVGVQFHPEVTTEIITFWVKDLPGELNKQIIRESELRLAENRKRCFALMDAFVAGWVR